MAAPAAARNHGPVVIENCAIATMDGRLGWLALRTADITAAAREVRAARRALEADR
jgi:hypothetical protein